MSFAPNRQDFIQKTNLGFTKKQCQQLSWVDFWEFGKDGYGTSGYSSNRKFEVSCSTCDKGNSFGSADSVRLFLFNHIGHNTYFFTHKR